jgi:hypothetical protein
VAGFDIIVFWGPPRYRRRSCLASDFVVLVLSEAVLSPPRRAVLVLDGCLDRSDADRRSKRFAGTWGPIGRIDILERSEYEYRDAEYEKKHEQSIGPKCSIGRFLLV